MKNVQDNIVAALCRAYKWEFFFHFERNFESKTMPIYLTISEFLSSELEHFDTFNYSRALFDSFGTIGHFWAS